MEGAAAPPRRTSSSGPHPATARLLAGPRRARPDPDTNLGAAVLGSAKERKCDFRHGMGPASHRPDYALNELSACNRRTANPASVDLQFANDRSKAFAVGYQPAALKEAIVAEGGAVSFSRLDSHRSPRRCLGYLVNWRPGLAKLRPIQEGAARGGQDQSWRPRSRYDQNPEA